MALNAYNLLTHLQFFKVDEIIPAKYEYLILRGAFPYKVTPDIDFTDEAIVQCDVPFVKMLFSCW